MNRPDDFDAEDLLWLVPLAAALEAFPELDTAEDAPDAPEGLSFERLRSALGEVSP